MTLQQLRYVREVIRRDLNVSAAAEALHTSQPGVSRQIRLLEEELSVRIFGRNGRRFTHLTPTGVIIAELATALLEQAERIRQVAAESASPDSGTITLATTHTQARYVLPPLISRFRRRYPNVHLHLHQGTPAQVARMVARGDADLAIASEAIQDLEDLVDLPCYRWDRCLLVPRDHPLTALRPLTLEAVAEYPIVTYVLGFTGRSRLDEAFAAKGLSPDAVLTATDADVIKTYVRLGLGVGIVAKMAYEAHLDHDLCALDASRLFAPSVARIGLRPDTFLRHYVYDFIELFAPHLTREVITRMMSLDEPMRAELLARLLESVPLLGAGDNLFREAEVG